MSAPYKCFFAMPPSAPLDMPIQKFTKSPVAHRADVPEHVVSWRIALFAPALTGTAILIHAMHGWLSNTGMTGLEWALLCLIGMTFIWVTLSVSTVGVALAGFLARDEDSAREASQPTPLNVALLIPIYNETVADVFGNATAMMQDIARCNSRHRYSLFVLSDTQDAGIAQEEERAFMALQQSSPAICDVFYRRRESNTDKKVGNIVDWITGWGAAYEAMIVLDADSLMTGRAIERLSDELSKDPSAGLIQSCPILIDADTVFARLQQFSNTAYGWLLAEGLANWVHGEGNYWGHNAIIRTRAFAQSAGLPKLPGRKGQNELILSHDFVEAGLLRRAGWRVRMLPRLSGSFEETPRTLVDYAQRDERWCHGNLQHLRLLGTAGLHPVSRYHLLHGAVSYLLSPAWFILLIVWFLLGKDHDTNVIRYFNEANPLFPDWPPAMSHIDSFVFLAIMYAMLLTPKIVAAAVISFHPKATRLYGGRISFLTAFLMEVMLSVAYAPIIMIQQTRAVFRAIVGRKATWHPQNRGRNSYPLLVLLRYHWVETTLGLIVTVGLISGLVSLWLVPIALSLLFAVPLSALSALPVEKFLPSALSMHNPHSLREPYILTQARIARRTIRSAATYSQVPAE